MESTVLFNDIISAFMECEDAYFFLTNDQLMVERGISREKVKELANQGLIPLPRKTPEFDKKIRDTFVFEIQDPKLAEKIFEAAMFADDRFDNILVENNLSEKWVNHKKKYSTNALINWLVKSNINLVGQKLIPDVAVVEIKPDSIPDEMKSLTPILCNACQNKTGLEAKYYKTDMPCDNLLMEKEAANQLKTKGIDNFTFLGREKKDMIATCTCPSCKGTDVNWDFH